MGCVSFDGGMNLQTAINLANTGIYAGNYPEYTLFDHKVQTGVTLLLPIAIIVNLLGQSMPVILSVNVMYILLLMMSLSLVFKLQKIRKDYFYITILMLVTSPQFLIYAMGVYGEIVALSVFICSIFFIMKSGDDKRIYFLLSGMFMGLAYLAKTVILIGFAAYIIVFILKLYFREINIKQILLWCAGFIIPIFFFELYKFIVFGNIYDYIKWWCHEFYLINSQAGLNDKYYDTNNIFIKIYTHIGILFKSFGIYAAIALSGCVIGLKYMYKAVRNKHISYVSLIIISGIIYLFWWGGERRLRKLGLGE